MTPQPVNKGGRPPGEETPESLIRKELIAHLKLYRRTREIVERRLAVDGLDVKELTEYMDLLRRGIGDLSKSIIPQAKPQEAKAHEPIEDPQLILQKLIEGSSH